MAIQHIVWLGLAPTGEGTVFVPTLGFTPGTIVIPPFVPGDLPTWKLRDPGTTWRLTDPGNTWKARSDTVVYATLERRARWGRLMNFDFSDFAELDAGQTITVADPVTATPAGLTIGTAAISGAIVQVRVSGGEAGMSYRLTSMITTSDGSTIDQDGILDVEAVP